ncbi:hypothetical protein ACMGGR_07325 [Erwinia sp. BNK-24-b]|uniref:hypothetical protein n=1 Tax=Erwinia TaxID=551 RepID=UPI001FEFCE67|nr:hypothetical protein [Erwinia phyllosphaerae]MBV4365270.1 hypothetical protein [Erwinia phyllosphaerae]
MKLFASFRKYMSAVSGWLSLPVSQEEYPDPSRMTESLLPVSQLYGFETSWLRARSYGEK